MAKKTAEQIRLGEVIRETVAAELDRVGEVKSSEIALIVRERNPDLVAKLSEQLFEAAIAGRIAAQLKSWFAVSHSAAVQDLFSSLPENVAAELPPTITVADEGREARHVLLERATVGELREYEAMLATQIAADQRKHRAVLFLVSKLKDVPNGILLHDAFVPIAAE